MRGICFTVVCLALLLMVGASAMAQQCTMVLPSFGNNFDRPVDNGAPTVGFVLNGAAEVVNKTVRLVPAVPYVAGSVFLDTALERSPWVAEFDFMVTKPNEFGAADGFTFAFINQYSSHLLGGWGGGLGVIGLNGYAVEFDTYTNTESEYPGGITWSPGDPGVQAEIKSHVGVTRTNPFQGLYATDSIPSIIEKGWFHAEVRFNAGQVQVYLSNLSIKYPRTLVMSYTIQGYKEGITAFGLTAGTGQGAAEFYVDNFRVYVPEW